jgi:MFS family permease
MEPRLNPRQRADLTYRWDRVRGVGNGVAETCWQVFALLVAIRVFAADASVKQFIPAGVGIGFLLSPLGLGLANRLRVPIASVIALIWLCVALALLGMTLATAVIPFVVFAILAQVAASQGVPILTHLYSDNYPSNQRGSRLATTFVIASSAGILFGYLGGRLLDRDVGLYPVIFGAGIAAALLGAFAVQRIPSEPADTLPTRNPIRGMAIAWQDRLFFRMLVAWMLMGMGNLMLIPLRVEYLANPVYGINASNAQISALLISVVLTFRLLSTKLWGHFFDRINVIVLRVFLNSVFMASIACFFFTDQLWLMAIGCALLGTAFGGGGILWALYVTKIAPRDKVAAYMSVHSFTSGIRMALAPFIGYAVMQIAHPSFAAWLALVMIGASTLMFLPLRRRIDALAEHLDAPPPPRMVNG